MSKQCDNPSEIQIDTDLEYQVSMETSKGNIAIELYASAAPITVNNFVFLIKEGFYDGVSFHRVIADFMIQGGDPTGTGTGGPGYRFEDEFDGNPHRHERGSLSMANSGPGTNGSQFFICHSPQAHLDGRHTVFGKVTEGLDIVDEIEAGDEMVKVTISG
jgi:peptidyl-prolyl cis-trans isomerase B (cyclophilin B)